MATENVDSARRNLLYCGRGTCERCTKSLSVTQCGGSCGLQISQSGWQKYPEVEIGDGGFVAGHWMGILWGIAVIYILHGRGRIIGLIAPGESLCAVATVGVVVAMAVEKRQICWAAMPNFAGCGQLKVCGRDSRPMIGPCYGGGQNGD
uniref:Uncharacterized protein n=1 Tax=Romanomermis culicivorax TaxID=13658 RepID=A0A915KV18_ROMCU